MTAINDLYNDELNTLYPEIKSDNSNNIFISNASNFTDLEKDIQKSDQIKLSQDIILENNEYSLYNKGIKINKNLTIDVINILFTRLMLQAYLTQWIMLH